MKKIVLFSLVGLLILLFGGCGLTPFTTTGVEQPPEVTEGLEIELDPAVNLELAQTKGSTIFIPNNDTSIGTWDPVTRIYTLTTDLNEGIEIDEDNLTLDGAGHTITGTGSGIGVYLERMSNVTVKNCVVSGFWNGIYLCYDSSNNTLTNNTVNTNYYGIRLSISSSNTLTGNTINNNNYYPIILDGYSNFNKVYNNNFIDNAIQAYNGGSGNEFYLAKPVGGNYWSDWTSPDVDYDGFVDSPYVFTGGQDNLPWVCQDGWKPAGATGYLITIVEDFELPTGIEKSLTVLLEAAINALDNYHEQAAIGQLTGFIHHVEGLQNGNILTEEQAQTLIAAAQGIIDSIQ